MSSIQHRENYSAGFFFKAYGAEMLLNQFFGGGGGGGGDMMMIPRLVMGAPPK